MTATEPRPGHAPARPDPARHDPDRGTALVDDALGPGHADAPDGTVTPRSVAPAAPDPLPDQLPDRAREALRRRSRARPAPPPRETLVHIPLEQIRDEALTRDRAGLDEAALWELRTSIAANGLRMPIEVFELAHPEPPQLYGLLSGFRRIRAFREQLEFTGQDRYRTIPAFVREPQSMAECLAAMVEENEIRAELSPWERGRIAYTACQREVFPSIEEAVAKLFPMANKDKRARFRSLARLVEEMDGCITEPDRLNMRQALRLANACRAGFGHVIRTALEESTIEDHEGQWQLILPIIVESERQPADDPLPNVRGLFRRPDRPRRVLHLRRDITIRREQTRDGWCLHFTGRLATSDFCDTVFDEIERKFAPENR